MNQEHTVFTIQKNIMQVYSRLLLNIDIQFEEALPQGPKLLVVNHPTTTDPFLLSLLVNEPICMLITGMAFEVPLLGKALQAGGHIAVSKLEQGGHGVVNQAVSKLAQGKTIGIFPEGALSPAIGEFCEPRSGAARIALLSGVPVIPVGIYLSHNAYIEKKLNTENYADMARWACRGDYFVTVGKARQYQGSVQDRDFVRSLGRSMMADIAGQAQKSNERMLFQQSQTAGKNLFLRLRRVLSF
ncbi:MAG: hypothetical protein CVU39_23595 [Chloroflexi bacterium HGW-Chloroflexi-10]|nr:MAG: hypothetical protein CVU39_23595 [Chloroflexi bacterium HGW-Chloroflexi-10]